MPSTPIPREATGLRLLAGAAVGALTAGYLIFHARTHSPDDLRSAAEHLLQGRTHWITFQNRLLAPLLVEGLRAITGWSWLRAFYALVAACLGGGAGLLLWRSWRDTGRSGRGLAQVVAWFFCAFVLNHQWSYPWDFTGALLFLLLMVWARDCWRALADVRSWRLAALLTALALNRESSLFVLAALGATVLVVGVVKKESGRGWLAAGLIALAGFANIVGVLLVRQALFVVPTRPAGSGGPEMAAGNFNQVQHNWQVLTHPREGWPAGAIIALLLIFCACLLRENCRALRPAHPVAPGRLFAQLCGVFGTGALLLFADVGELRVYFEFTPVWVVLAFESKAWHAGPLGG